MLVLMEASRLKLSYFGKKGDQRLWYMTMFEVVSKKLLKTGMSKDKFENPVC